MPDYTFTGAYPRVLAGLSQGVNASLSPAVGLPPVHGSTLEAAPGDAVHTDEPYIHPELAEVAPATESPLPLSDESQAGIQVLRDAAAAAAPIEPAPDTMTAEGAPAPAEPTA